MKTKFIQSCSAAVERGSAIKEWQPPGRRLTDLSATGTSPRSTSSRRPCSAHDSARKTRRVSSSGDRVDPCRGEAPGLRAAPALGALVMAFIMAHHPPLRHAGKTLMAAVAGFGVATIVFGLSRNFWLSMAALAVTGMLDNVSVVVRRLSSTDRLPLIAHATASTQRPHRMH